MLYSVATAFVFIYMTTVLVQTTREPIFKNGCKQNCSLLPEWHLKVPETAQIFVCTLLLGLTRLLSDYIDSNDNSQQQRRGYTTTATITNGYIELATNRGDI